jgi:hypothetical protein
MDNGETEVNDTNWITGGNPQFIHQALIDRGAFGEVHKVYVLQELNLIITASRYQE